MIEEKEFAEDVLKGGKLNLVKNRAIQHKVWRSRAIRNLIFAAREAVYIILKFEIGTTFPLTMK